MYAKVFSQMYDGSLCTQGPWEALVTFQQLLVLADQDGNVDMTAQAISRRTTIPLEIIERGIEELAKPDPESRTPTEEGKRIIPLSDDRSWGWRVVNYKHYRQLKREEDRREYHREYWHKRKSTQQTQQTQPNQPIAEAEAEAKKEEDSGAALRAAPTPPPLFDGDNGKTLGARSLVALDAAFELPEDWGLDAEALGFKAADILREAEKFRQYWVAGKGSGKKRTLKGWRQSWSNWLAKAAERA
jgi:hypothetical protein